VPKTLRDLNTLQKESNKFEVRTWNSNLDLFPSFNVKNNPSSNSDSRVMANWPKKQQKQNLNLG
jgi:hypothetical protein